jgi:hypothetical protein
MRAGVPSGASTHGDLPRPRTEVNRLQQIPRIVKSELTKPPRWYVATCYRLKSAINADTGEPTQYLVASRKFDVTDQMEVILAAEKGQRR